jgi:hypothetical protein
MTPVPTCPRVAPCSLPSSTLRAGSADGLRPCLTATAPAAWETHQAGMKKRVRQEKLACSSG